MTALCRRILSYSDSCRTVWMLDSSSAFPSRHSTAWHRPTLAAFRVKQLPGSPGAAGSCLMWHKAAEPPILWPAVPSFLQVATERNGVIHKRLFSCFTWNLVHLPLHGEESVGHVVFLPWPSVQLLSQNISHSALQQVRHLHVSVSVKDAIQSFTSPAEGVLGQSCHTKPEKNGQLASTRSDSKWNFFLQSRCKNQQLGDFQL